MSNPLEVGMIGILESSKKTKDIGVDSLKITVKYPSLMETAKIGVIRAKMLDGANDNSVDAFTDNLCYMIATLAVVTIKAPNSWNVYTLEDYAVLESLYKQYSEWVESFRGRDNLGSDEENSIPRQNEETLGDNEGIQATS